MIKYLFYVFTLTIISLPGVYADENSAICDDMIGTYSVIPFSEPQHIAGGLAEAVENVLTPLPIGDPVFKVTQLDGKAFHVGLRTNARHPISFDSKPIRVEREIGGDSLLFLTDFLDPSAISCFYLLLDKRRSNDDENSEAPQISKVDLTKLDTEQLEFLLNYMARTWGSAMLDDDDYHDLLKKFNLTSKKRILDIKAMI